MNPSATFDFEAPLVKILHRLEELRLDPLANAREIEKVEARAGKVRAEIYAKLSRWEKTQVARHPRRPDTLELIRLLMSDFVEFHGDRTFADDPAIVCGFAVYHRMPVAVVGHQKGRDTKQKVYRNFGMPRPEGYRKALRIMKLAEKFARPILTFIDTPGADPGIGAEERGQAEAIAVNLREMAQLRVPVVATVTGEGGSGGALAIGVADVVNMMEFSVYSVISPEACSSILWRSPENKAEAAEALKLAATDLKELGIIDSIVPEPTGGAHNDPEATAENLDRVLLQSLDSVSGLDPDERLERRYRKFRAMGFYAEQSDASGDGRTSA